MRIAPIFLSITLFGCGVTMESSDAALDAAVFDGAVSDSSVFDSSVLDASVDASAAPDAAADAGLPDAGPVPGAFDDSTCAEGPTHLWSNKSPTRFSSEWVHGESRPGRDFLLGGLFGDEIRLGEVELIAGDQDSYVALVAPDGTFRWSAHLTGAGRQRVSDVARGVGDRLIAVGEFTEELRVGGETVAGRGPDISHLFVVCFLPTGELEWLKTFVGGGSDHATALSTDGDGNIFLAGSFDDPLVLDGNVVRATAPGISSSRGQFVASFDVDGAYRWSHGYPSFGVFNSMTVDDAGHVYATGRYDRSFVVVDEALPEPVGRDALVVRYDNDGEPSWAQTLSGPGYDAGESISANAGLVVVVGRFRDSLDERLVGLGREDMMVVAYDEAGTEIFRRSLGGSLFARADAVSVNDVGDVLVSGRYTDSLMLRSGPVAGPGIVLFSLDRSGACRWFHPIESEVSAGATALAFGEAGQLFFAGWANGPTDLGGGAFPNGAGSFFASME